MTQPTSEHPPTFTARLGHALGRMALAFADIYGALILLLMVLWPLFDARWWALLLARDLLPWLLLPPFAIGAALLATRHPLRAIPHGMLVIVFIALYGGLFLPDRQPDCVRDGGCQTMLRVMTYNLGASLADPQRVAAMVHEQRPDIIALNEVGVEHARALDALLADEYPHRAMYGAGIPGKALLSRYPILDESGPFTLNTLMTHFSADIAVNGETLRVIVGHPPRPSFELGLYAYPPGTAEDVAALVEMAGSGGPALLAGDFNMTEHSPGFSTLRESGLHDAFRESGWGLGMTFPVWRRFGELAGLPLTGPPAVRIDYIFHTDHFAALHAWVGEDAGSDHLPLFADLAWQP